MRRLFNMEVFVTPEGKNVAYLKKRVKELGGECRKCSWDGHAGAPDWLIMLARPACHFWCEMKAPGERPRPIQKHEIHIMQTAGCVVFVCDSPAEIDDMLKIMTGDTLL